LIQVQLVCAQSKYDWKTGNRFKGNRYHFVDGWINAGGVHILPHGPITFIQQTLDGVGETLPSQFDYLRYKHFNERLAYGGSIAFSQYSTGELGYENYPHYRFLDIGIYGKLILLNKRIRPYFDAKLGVSIALNRSIEYYCNNCDVLGRIKHRFTSGPMLQPGIGFDFANSKRRKWGLKFSHQFILTMVQHNLRERSWKVTENGIVKRNNRLELLNALFIGANLYF